MSLQKQSGGKYLRRGGGFQKKKQKYTKLKRVSKNQFTS
jgi:hypothetical protein